MLEEIYKDLLSEYQADAQAAQSLWDELHDNYTGSKRHYHNLDHLSDIYSQLVPVKPKIKNWNVILFTLFYHDAIYKATKKDNEEASAKLAVQRMTELGIAKDEINLCSDQIIATKGHGVSPESDTNYFTDADLSILGRDSDTYKKYREKIRKEYSIYPNFLYNPGRKKVVNHFLSMERIYKTEEFYSKFEEQAKSNLQRELQTI